MLDQTPTVLVADDQPINREIIAALLEPEGYQLLFAIDGVETMAALEQEPVDVLLLDIMMPLMDGYEVCRQVRASEQLADLPIVMVTALADRESRLQGIDAGADDFISKPIDADELRARVRGITRLNRYRRLLEKSNQLHYLEMHDSLTGLPNRANLTKQLNTAMTQAWQENKRTAVLNIDLDGFRAVNDALGSRVGDELLKSVATRLQQALPENTVLARFGSVKFVALVNQVSAAEELITAAQSIQQVMRQSFAISQRQLHLGSQIGIGLYPGDGEDADTLLSNAALAANEARSEGRGQYRFFTPDIDASARERFNLELDLRKALEQNEFELFFQPKIDLADDSVTGVEALLRWHHPERGLVAPDNFIPAAEKSGLIIAIGEWVLAEACRQAKAWREAGLAPLRVAVNISSKQLGPGLLDTVQRSLEAVGLSGEALELELTESVLMVDHRASQQNAILTLLHQLKALGVKLSVDDFGTGYSSLSYLKKLPVDVLKIDKVFIDDVPRDQDDIILTETIINMARSLRLDVIAEGVETQEQVAFLQDRQCQQAQGYLYSKPVPSAEFEQWLRQRKQTVVA